MRRMGRSSEENVFANKAIVAVFLLGALWAGSHFGLHNRLGRYVSSLLSLRG